MLNPLWSRVIALLPWVAIQDGHIGPLPIHPFGLLVATGVILGHRMALNRAKVLGLDERRFENLVFATVATGFVLSHVLDTIFYYPGVLRDDPLKIFRIWEGLSSFGGFFGAAIGFAIYALRHRIDVPSPDPGSSKQSGERISVPPPPGLARTDLWKSADAIGYGLPVGWFFGRMGCSSVHDHPGRPSESFFALNYPLDWRGQGHPIPAQDGLKEIGPFIIKSASSHGMPRFDLGVAELMLTPLLIAAALIVARRTRKPGSVVAVLALVYPFLRFPLDYLRVTDAEGGDIRYFGFTPGQYACALLFALGLWIVSRIRKLPDDAPVTGPTVDSAAAKA